MRWISSRNSTSPSVSEESIAARSPACWIAGPLVIRSGTPSSAATIIASVVLPRPGGPASRTWSGVEPRPLAAERPGRAARVRAAGRRTRRASGGAAPPPRPAPAGSPRRTPGRSRGRSRGRPMGRSCAAQAAQRRLEERGDVGVSASASTAISAATTETASSASRTVQPSPISAVWTWPCHSPPGVR